MPSKTPAQPKSLDESLAGMDLNSKNPGGPQPKAAKVPYKAGITFEHQSALKKLPIPELHDTCRKYLDAVRPLQTPREHKETEAAVKEFLKTDGPELQERLKKYAATKPSYIEQFCMHIYPINFLDMLLIGL